MSLLSCARLGFAYPGRGGPLLSDFSLDLAEGEIVTLLGPSGCGKTTLLKLLSGFLRPDAGTLSYRGEPLESPFPGGQMIFQDSAQLLPWLNVEDNILFPLQSSSFPWGSQGRAKRKRSLRPRLDEMLANVGLNGYGPYHPAQLSGGMKQRCALGRALMADAQILFLDEPFGSLDAPSRSELQTLLLTLWEERGFSMIFVTHDIAEALLLSDRIVLFSAEGPEAIRVDLPRPRDRGSRDFRERELGLYSELSDAGRTL